MAQHVEIAGADQVEKGRGAEGAVGNDLGALREPGRPLRAHAVIAVRRAAQRRDNLVAGFAEFASEPEAGEGAGAGQQDVHVSPRSRSTA